MGFEFSLCMVHSFRGVYITYIFYGAVLNVLVFLLISPVQCSLVAYLPTIAAELSCIFFSTCCMYIAYFDLRPWNFCKNHSCKATMHCMVMLNWRRS